MHMCRITLEYYSLWVESGISYLKLPSVNHVVQAKPAVYIYALYILWLLQILLEVKEKAIDYKDYTDSIVEEGVHKKDKFGTLGDNEEKPE